MSVPNVLLRFMSVPQAFRAAESLNGWATPPGSVFGRGVQKFAAFGSSVSRPPTMHQFVIVRRWLLKLCIE